MSLRQLVSVFFLFVLGSQLLAAAPVTLEEIKTAWKDREEKLRTVHLEWQAIKILPRGSNTQLFFTPPKEGEKLQPPTDQQVNEKGQFLSNRSMTKIVIDSARWSVKQEKVYPFRLAESISETGKVRSVQEPETLEHFYPMGRIQPKTDTSHIHNFAIQPLLMNFAIGTQQKSHYFHLDRWELTGRQVQMNHRTCIELSKPSQNKQSVETLYLAVDRGFLPVRHQELTNGAPTFVQNMSYLPDRVIGWRLDKWDHVLRIGGVLHSSGNYQTIGFTANAELSEEDFTVDFPVGTRVLDSSSGSEVQYIVKEAQTTTKPITIASKITYEEMVQMPAHSQWHSNYLHWGLASLALLVLIVVVFVVLRRGYSPHSERTSSNNP